MCGESRTSLNYAHHFILYVAGALLLVAILVLAVYGVRAIYDYDQAIRDAYAADWASALIADYIESHGGTYPQSWEDLRPLHDKLSERDNSWSIEELRRRVSIRWDAATPKRSERFISLTSGRQGFLSSPDPNQRIADALAKWAKMPK
jgi:hypothetical protein